jgi:hypothetical protein
MVKNDFVYSSLWTISLRQKFLKLNKFILKNEYLINFALFNFVLFLVFLKTFFLLSFIFILLFVFSLFFISKKWVNFNEL